MCWSSTASNADLRDRASVHRNTLRDRIARIAEATGFDLECAEGRGLAWLAWLGRRDMDNSAIF
jgi:DNA-binding PucR family transcriptional regulator